MYYPLDCKELFFLFQLISCLLLTFLLQSHIHSVLYMVPTHSAIQNMYINFKVAAASSDFSVLSSKTK